MSLATKVINDHSSLEIAPDAWKFSRPIYALDISYKWVRTIPAACLLSVADSLIELSIHMPRLNTFPVEISKLTHLRTLKITGGVFTHIDEKVCDLSALSQLETLFIQNGLLAQLPSQISKLTNLTCLSVAGNQLTALPDDIGNCSLLQTLDISDNQISVLPESMGNLTNLRGLYAHNNHLKTIPSSIMPLFTNLMRAYLSNNYFDDEVRDNIIIKCNHIICRI